VSGRVCEGHCLCVCCAALCWVVLDYALYVSCVCGPLGNVCLNCILLLAVLCTGYAVLCFVCAVRLCDTRLEDRHCADTYVWPSEGGRCFPRSCQGMVQA
jgi:hypothetical protein